MFGFNKTLSTNDFLSHVSGIITSEYIDSLKDKRLYDKGRAYKLFKYVVSEKNIKLKSQQHQDAILIFAGIHPDEHGSVKMMADAFINTDYELSRIGNALFKDEIQSFGITY